MLRRQMRFAEQYQDHRIRMALTNLGNLVRCMPISGPNLAQVFPRLTIEAIDCVGVFAGGYQQFVKGGPPIAPVEIETDALTELFFIDLTPPPLIEDVLMAGENRLDSEHDWTVSRLRPLLQQSRGKTLCRGERVIIADQDHIGRSDRSGQLLRIDNRLVGTESIAVVPQILAAPAGIIGANLALDASQRVHLRGVAAGSQIG